MEERRIGRYLMIEWFWRKIYWEHIWSLNNSEEHVLGRNLIIIIFWRNKYFEEIWRLNDFGGTYIWKKFDDWMICRNKYFEEIVFESLWSNSPDADVVTGTFRLCGYRPCCFKPVWEIKWRYWYSWNICKLQILAIHQVWYLAIIAALQILIPYKY